MEPASPARLYCLVAGALLVALGLVGFAINADFATGEAVRDERGALAGLDLNGWLNAVRTATGLAALAAATLAARAGALGLGVAYLALGALGLTAAGDVSAIFEAVATDRASDALHLTLGVAGLAARAGSRPPRSRR